MISLRPEVWAVRPRVPRALMMIPLLRSLSWFAIELRKVKFVLPRSCGPPKVHQASARSPCSALGGGYFPPQCIPTVRRCPRLVHLVVAKFPTVHSHSASGVDEVVM